MGLLDSVLGAGASFMTGGLVGAGLGDLLSAVGSYTKGDGNSASNAAIAAQNKVMDNVQERIPSLMGQLNYNAMGQTGAQAQLGANKALGAWGNSAQGMNAYNRAQQDADQLRSLTNTQGNLALGNSQKQSSKLINQSIQAMMAGGASPAAMAAAGGKIAGAQAENNNQLLQSLASQVSGNIANANQIQQGANQSLMADKQMEFNKVTPYLNQRESLAGALGSVVNAASPVASVAASENQKVTGNYLGGLSSLLGKAGANWMGLGQKQGATGFDNQTPTIMTGNSGQIPTPTYQPPGYGVIGGTNNSQSYFNNLGQGNLSLKQLITGQP